ncbi:MAG: TlpA family protein disulfide reductase [Alphaproteobacteria bacterium]|nr:TlpA family protein disulfide reductase [Candidatus Jidaibacter sp.]
MRIICIFSISIQLLQSLFIQVAKAADFSLNSDNKAEAVLSREQMLQKKDELDLYDIELKSIKPKELIFKPFLEPKLSFSNLDDMEISLKSYRNNFLIIYFFASWCTSCAGDIKSIAKLADKINFTDTKDVKIILISEDFKSKEQVFMSLSGVASNNFDILFDKNRVAMSSLGVKSLPTAFLVNKEGFVFAKIERNLEWSAKVMFDDIIDLKDNQHTQIDRKNVYSFDPSEDIIYKKTDKKPVTIIN